jgi:hypothetical protein
MSTIRGFEWNAAMISEVRITAVVGWNKTDVAAFACLIAVSTVQEVKYGEKLRY